MTERYIITDPASMLDALRTRIAELQLSYESVDDLAGLADRYCCKLMTQPPMRQLGRISYWVLPQALGLRIVLEPDPDLCRRMAPRWQKRIRPRPALAGKMKVTTSSFGHVTLTAISRMGGEARAQKLSARRRRQIAKIAVAARELKRREGKSDARTLSAA